jgi:hypothetical protein
MFVKIQSWDDLAKVIATLTPEQRKKPIQATRSHPVDEFVHDLQPAFLFGTIDGIGIRYARSCEDNRRHGDDLIIMTDSNPFGLSGSIGSRGVEIGRRGIEAKDPIFPANHDASMDWRGPAQKLLAGQEVEPDGSLLEAILSHRTGEFPADKD